MLFKKINERKEAELKRQKKNVIKKMGIAFAVGSAISALVTLFTAPKSGKEMRKDVVDKVGEGADLVKDGATKAVKKTSDVMSDALQKGQKLKDKVVLKVTSSKNDLKGDVKEGIETAAEAIEEKMEDVVDSVEEKLE